MEFALNCINVPSILAKKGDTNQNIRYEIVPLAKMGIFMELPSGQNATGNSLFLLPFYLIFIIPISFVLVT